MKNRKLPLMHELYGIAEGKKCRNCCNLMEIHAFRGNTKRVFHKCRVYGDSGGEASDWGLNFLACGLYDILCDDKPILERIRDGEI